MAKYNKKRVKHICDLLSKDSYTIAEICSLSKINIDTYYDWLKNKPDFSEAVRKARQQFDELIVNEAKNSLRKKVSGYTVHEKHVTFVGDKNADKNAEKNPDGTPKPKIKEQKIIEKHFQPDTAAIIFALTNKAPDEYKNRTNTELTGKDGKAISIRVEDLETASPEILEKLAQANVMPGGNNELQTSS